jgi:nicotinate-nucleotide adenylyltransferase
VTSIGILGGTFNPPHRGHIALARHARAQLGLERVLLMPAHSAPHKREADPDPSHRLQMCRLAAAGVLGVAACAIEIERGGPSYTVDTLEAIHGNEPDAELTFIVGADVARMLPAWREPERVLELARLAVAEREDVGRADVLRALDGLALGAGTMPARGAGPAAGGARGVVFLKLGTIDVSSSMVRKRVARGEPVEELVGSAVAAYIAAHELYGAGAQGHHAMRAQGGAR